MSRWFWMTTIGFFVSFLFLFQEAQLQEDRQREGILNSSRVEYQLWKYDLKPQHNTSSVYKSDQQYSKEIMSAVVINTDVLSQRDFLL